MDPRLIAIEEKLAHVERHVEALDGELREVYRRNERLERQVEALRRLLENRTVAEASHETESSLPGALPGALPGSLPGAGADDEALRQDKPPHW